MKQPDNFVWSFSQAFVQAQSEGRVHFEVSAWIIRQIFAFVRFANVERVCLIVVANQQAACLVRVGGLGGIDNLSKAWRLDQDHRG